MTDWPEVIQTCILTPNEKFSRVTVAPWTTLSLDSPKSIKWWRLWGQSRGGTPPKTPFPKPSHPGYVNTPADAVGTDGGKVVYSVAMEKWRQGWSRRLVRLRPYLLTLMSSFWSLVFFLSGSGFRKISQDSPSWHSTSYVEQAGLELVASLAPASWVLVL